ncbi:TonB-dependent receptor SusC [Chryseobacterium aquaeductus]|uniref:TonB-dependent receptor SusC n=1 Tax=Chryseobacterium aquaeductus TaxID=2675056 RepID=A0A9N8MGI6_9FLAO|nr:SusC/RagA family TonB-linked outer membrane protein [Chryseobacterium aquaeductus]CAA7331369.1 TonB-dependent receptor SusC [Chryseobacterium potabilaquae]CAD7809791.1 TonB-dependent receptor SusC [Chryseobacterium aquaeductus]
MKKLTAGVLVLVLSSSFVVVNAQNIKKDTVRTQEIEGVVVTALGIKREKKSLGYSSQQLNASQVNSSPTNNFLNNLSGKVAGLDVKMNSNFGGSTNIVMRGIKSITGNNQALIVVDGVPISNANLNTSDAKNGRDGYDFGNAASDIDPNNIESVNVLKGAAATVLYGSLAANGAIMITTKKGKKNSGLGVSYSSTVSVGTFDKSTFAKYQKDYGQGYAGEDSSYIGDINGDGIDDGLIASAGDDASYGNAFNPNVLVYNWDAFIDGHPNYQKATPWVAAKNDPTKFFKKSYSLINSIAVNGGTDKSAYNFGYTNNYETGILPNSSLNKNTITGNYSYDLSDKLKANAFMTFTNQSTIGRNSVGYGDNIIGGFRQWWATNVDVLDLREQYFRTKKNVTWNMKDPTNGDLAPNFWDNPYWSRYENYESDTRRRFLTGASISYDITKDLNLLARVGIDYTNDRQEMRKAVGSHAEEFGISQTNQSSGYELFTRSFMQQNYDFIASYDVNINDKINGKLIGGYNFIKQDIEAFNGSTTGGLLKPNFYSLQNSKTFIAPIETNIAYKKSGVYGQASFDYDKTLFLEGSYRHDESTALPSENGGYNYWSLGSSFIFSEFIKKSWLNLGKLRLNYAEVGNDPAPGRLGWLNNNGGLGNGALFDLSNTYLDFSKLRPEVTKSWEAGLELQMFKNRLGLDVSLYKTNSVDQIFAVPTTGASGYLFKMINAGELENKGIEIGLNGTPIKTNDFRWNINVNWSTNKNKLLYLDEGRSNLVLANFQHTSLNATVGEAYGTIRGTDYVYDSNGNKVVGDDGYYLQKNNQVLGNIQADWLGGVSNTFTYKNFSVGFLIDVRKGGDVFSLDQIYGQETGLYPNTVGLNDLGNPIRNTLDQGGGTILPGVKEDGTPNDIRIDGSYSTGIFGSVNPEKAFVYDASYVKLREASITYTLPSKVFEGTVIRSASFSLLGNNLWIIHKNLPMADPEAGSSGGNVQGYQSGVMPTVRTISFNVKVNF